MLDKGSLAASIKSAFEAVMTLNQQSGTTPEQAITKVSQDLAEAIDTYVKAGEVKFAIQEIAVATSGTATSQTGGNVAEITKKLE